MENNSDSQKPEISAKEKELLRTKLENLMELEMEEKDLRKKKKEIENNLNEMRPELDTTLQSVGRTRVKFNKTLVSRVPKSQHRKPTLQLTYQAIENVLGKTAMEKVKEAVKEKRQSLMSEVKGDQTLKIIPLKERRKTRKDKKPEKEKKKEEKKGGAKKLKFMKKQKREQ